MPCHSTPHQAYLHRPDVRLRFLTCEPPLGCVPPPLAAKRDTHRTDRPGVDLKAYRDEADQFYDDPDAWLGRLLPLEALPSHVIMFEPLVERVAAHLGARGRECARFFNSHFIDDDRKRGDVVVYCAG